jgi:ribosomal protein S18 acetylase RimI-like enzyme
MTAPIVRDATPDDVDAILDIAQRAWRDTYGDILQTATIESALDEWYERESTRAAIDDDEIAYFVAEDDDSVVGYLSGRQKENGETATISAIYADPNRRGEGIGTALLERFEEFCRDRGCRTIELWALAENDIGHSFYQSRGFEPVERKETELFGEQASETLFSRPVE